LIDLVFFCFLFCI